MPVQKKSGNFLNAPRICLSIYLSIVFHRQTVLLYHKSSVSQDTWDGSSWDQNPVDLRQSDTNLKAIVTLSASEGIFYIYITYTTYIT